ncbi:HAD domain-containing protein [Paenibacillus sp. HJGM_3]|uniref:HAD domain-containing protein n=1 Tax=Paenibacillus sp. HJGM_3 TaxID=3379816 RepID=UPI00385C62B8
MKLIFLDIDGVMNHRDYMVRSRLHHMQEFCPVAVRNLREIVKRTGAKIVLSSTWRKFKDIYHVMTCYDLDQYVIGKTPVIEDVIRGIEIKQFMDELNKPIESYVILDDDDDMGDLLPHLVHCKDYSGLTDERREEAIALLNREQVLPQAFETTEILSAAVAVEDFGFNIDSEIDKMFKKE